MKKLMMRNKLQIRYILEKSYSLQVSGNKSKQLRLTLQQVIEEKKLLVRNVWKQSLHLKGVYEICSGSYLHI